MSTRVKMGLLAVATVMAGAPIAWGLTLFDPAYQFESFSIYPAAGESRAMMFGPDGAVYVSYYNAWLGQPEGSIYRAEPDNVASVWVDGLYHPMSMVWAGEETAYGPYYYLADMGTRPSSPHGDILRVSLDGTVTVFTKDKINQVTTIALDRTGRFDAHLYAGQGAHDKIFEVFPDGGTRIVADFGDVSGSLWDMAFDTAGRYGQDLYVATTYTQNPGISGVLRIDPDDNLTRFAEAIVEAYSLAFDEAGFFGNDLFVRGLAEGDGRADVVYRVAPDGTITPFAHFTGDFTFGPDGMMYAYEREYGMSTLYRITPIPEPATVLLLGLGMTALRRRR